MPIAHTKFLFTTVSPYGPPHKDTIARWVKNTLTQAGVNTNIFSSHSCRSSASSKADNMGVDLDNILKMGCWSRQSTFWKFYSKELEYMDKNNRVAETIVNSFKNQSCNDIYDTAINIHHPKYFQSAFQFQILLTYTPLEMQVNRNYKLIE